MDEVMWERSARVGRGRARGTHAGIQGARKVAIREDEAPAFGSYAGTLASPAAEHRILGVAGNVRVLVAVGRLSGIDAPGVSSAVGTPGLNVERISTPSGRVVERARNKRTEWLGTTPASFVIYAN